jgi:hypothetical protein
LRTSAIAATTRRRVATDDAHPVVVTRPVVACPVAEQTTADLQLIYS